MPKFPLSAFSRFWISFLKELRKLIEEVRKGKIAGIKTILVVTMSTITIITTFTGALHGEPYVIFVTGGIAFLIVLYIILKGCVKIDRRRYPQKMRRRPKQPIGNIAR